MMLDISVELFDSSCVNFLRALCFSCVGLADKLETRAAPVDPKAATELPLPILFPVP
jgi:hypothetical protein